MDLERYRFGQLRDGYLECIQRMVDQLHVDAVRCSTMHELKTASIMKIISFCLLRMSNIL